MEGRQLRDWQIRCGLRTAKQAAAALRISVGTYRNRVKGRVRISDESALLTAYIEIHSIRWLNIADAAYRLARITDVAVTPAAKAAVIDLVADAPTQDNLRR